MCVVGFRVLDLGVLDFSVCGLDLGNLYVWSLGTLDFAMAMTWPTQAFSEQCTIGGRTCSESSPGK